MTPRAVIRIGLVFMVGVLAACGQSGGARPEGGRPDQTQNAFLDPSHPGPYLAGNTSFVFEDPGRLLSCGAGNRRLVTEVWYPAADEAVGWPENRMSDFFLDQFEAAVEALRQSGQLPDGEFHDFTTGSFRDAPVHPDAPAMPILIFSHGFSSNRFQNYTMCNYLASHGYLVVSPDHTCNAKIAPLPEGIVLFTWSNALASLSERMDDMSFLIDVFTGDPPEKFEGRLDPERIGFWGHSYGGMTVTEQLKVEPRVSAMLQMASFGFPFPPVPEGLSAATLFMWGEQDKVMAPFEDLHDEVVSQMPVPKYELEFLDTGHFAFSDLCVFLDFLLMELDGCGRGTRIATGEPFENPDHGEMHQILNAYATAFFGASFFGDPELSNYLLENHFPERVRYNPMVN